MFFLYSFHLFLFSVLRIEKIISSSTKIIVEMSESLLIHHCNPLEKRISSQLLKTTSILSKYYSFEMFSHLEKDFTK